MFLGRDRLIVVSSFEPWSGGGNGDVHLDVYEAGGRFFLSACTWREFQRKKLRRLAGHAYTHEQIKNFALQHRFGLRGAPALEPTS
jgi:hypothetical protein